jgi:pyruvate-ferredoxin/flavodoxin oxidoreductase
MGTSIFEENRAVEAGYWHLYRYDPRNRDKGQNPFMLDSKEPTASYRDFLHNEVRYSSLMNVFPDIAGEMFEASEKNARERYETYKRMAAMEFRG